MELLVLWALLLWLKMVNRFMLAHRYAIFLCSLDVEIHSSQIAIGQYKDYLHSWATSYKIVDICYTLSSQHSRNLSGAPPAGEETIHTGKHIQ